MTHNVSSPPQKASLHMPLPLSGIFCIYYPITPSPKPPALTLHSKPGALKSSLRSQRGCPVLRNVPQSSPAFG